MTTPQPSSTAPQSTATPRRKRRGRAGCLIAAGAAVVTAIIAVLVFVMVLLSIIGGAAAQEQEQRKQSQRCVGGAPVGSAWQPPSDAKGTGEYGPRQVALARTLWETAHKLGYGDKGGVIVVAAAMQEASLEIDPTPDENQDLGPLQQRWLVGWYGGRPTREENRQVLTDPVQAARIFLEGHTLTAQEISWASAAGDQPAGPAGYHIPGLRDVRGWQDMELTAAIQKVQGSATPTAYAKREASARAMIATFGAAPAPDPGAVVQSEPSAPADCGPTGAPTVMNCPPSGLAVEQGLTPDAQLVVRCAHQRFPQVRDWAGIGDRPSNVDRDHQEGRGVDLMTYADSALGDQISKWAQENAASLGVKYLIWNAHIWSVDRAGEGWRACGTAAAKCYAGPDPTAAHRDHVHVSVLGNGAAKAPAAGPGGGVPGAATQPVAPGSYSRGAGWGAVGSWSRYHTGVDLSAGMGTPIRAAAGGAVEAPNGGGWAGIHVVIRHGDGSATLYAHMTRSMVQVGQQVQTGQQIGLVGQTGRAFGPHLHFEHYPAGRGVIGNPYTTDDPVKWMQSLGVTI